MTNMSQSRRHQSQLRDLEARIVEAHKETNFYRDELTMAQKRVSHLHMVLVMHIQDIAMCVSHGTRG
jgi:hypothetical protein